jgi:hypothetical protein
MPLFGAPFRGLWWKLRTVMLECGERDVSSLVMLRVVDVERAGRRPLPESSCGNSKPRLNEGSKAILCADASAMVRTVRELSRKGRWKLQKLRPERMAIRQ